MHTCVCGCKHLGLRRVQNRTLNSPELELQMFVEYLPCYVGAEVQTLVLMIA